MYGLRHDARGLPPLSAPLQETRRLVDSILSIQPRLAAGAAGRSPDDIVSSLAAELLAALPPPLLREEAALGLFDRTASGQLKSLSVVLGQELDRFNRLHAAVAGSLGELQKAIKGLVVMSGELEGVYNSMLNNQVPARGVGVWRLGRLGYGG